MCITDDEEEDEDVCCEICGIKQVGVEFDYDDDCGFYCCQDEKCLRQFWKECPPCNCHETGEIDEDTGFKVMDCDLCGEGLIEDEDK